MIGYVPSQVPVDAGVMMRAMKLFCTFIEEQMARSPMRFAAAMVIDMSTVNPETSLELSKLGSERQLHAWPARVVPSDVPTTMCVWTTGFP